MYQINMFCAINLHNVLCQIYFNRRTYHTKKERTIQSSTFPKLHAESSQEKSKREIYKGWKSQMGNLRCPRAPTDSPHILCTLSMANPWWIQELLSQASGRTRPREERKGVEGEVNVKHAAVLQGTSRDQNRAIPTAHIWCTAKSRSLDRELWEPEPSKTDSTSGSRLQRDM